MLGQREIRLSNQWESYNKSFLCDGIRFLCGEMLGAGISREVFVYDNNDEFVIKVETEADYRFQNVTEYNFWNDVREWPEVLRWIAPCVRISPHGNYLMQERTYPVTLEELKKQLPKVPTYLSDLKVGNWGRLPNGKIVCHDYGTHVGTACMSTRIVKADWWE